MKKMKMQSLLRNRLLAITLSALALPSFCGATKMLAAAQADSTVAPSQVILDVSAPASLARLAPTSDQVTITSSNDAAPGINVSIVPGKEGYPGVRIKPEGGAWDLSKFGHVEARVTNTGEKPISIALRVDNNGNWQDNPWNAESVYLKPGATGTVSVIFGYAYGHQPNYALNPAQIVNMMLFVGKSDSPQSFRIESLVASGPAGEKPPIDPNSIRTKPDNGFLLGGGASVDATKQISVKNAQAVLSDDRQSLRTTFPAAKGEQSATLKPVIGRWDLRDDLEVRVRLRNDGQAPVAPRVRVESNGGPSAWSTPAAPLAPGVQAELVIPFTGPSPVDLNNKESKNRIASNAVSGITIGAEPADGERVLTVQSITADMPAEQIPDWLGKRPAVEGDWTQTLNENFDGNSVNTSLWNVQGANYYDKRTHWSKDDVLVSDGVVKLHYEKKRGFQNDDPKAEQTDYAAGFLTSFDRWAQRYGYFEARMKLPKAPGLWPAFWLMPDRGAAAGIWWKRNSTSDGGMEFDVMEHLTGWGPNRYNIAMHWDGYDKNHKADGSDKIYVQPDKDGFITVGLLWTPGSAIYYCNGKEVLRWQNERIANVPEHLLFTLPSGGWDNLPLDDKQLPADFIVDYVRVWQRKDLAEAAPANASAK